MSIRNKFSKGGGVIPSPVFFSSILEGFCFPPMSRSTLCFGHVFGGERFARVARFFGEFDCWNFDIEQ